MSAWFKQTALFITAWFFVKLTVQIALTTFPFFAQFAQWLLSPLEKGDSRVQVIVVMLIFPLIMNVVQAWLIDMVIKGKSTEIESSDSFESVLDGVDDEESAYKGEWKRVRSEDDEIPQPIASSSAKSPAKKLKQ